MSVSALYKACRNGDLDEVQQLLPTLTLDEINQKGPKGSTSLHAACHFNHPQIVELLLDCGALRTTKNDYGCTAFDEAATEQVKQLFPRPFGVAQERFAADILSEQLLEWASLSNGRYGWRNKEHMDNMDVTKATDSIVKDERFQNAPVMNKTEYFLNKARQTQDPEWFVKAYSADMGFCQTINRALALGPSSIPDSVVKDGFHAFVGVLCHHYALKKYRYAGKCYRGMKLSTKDFEYMYKVGYILLIKPFMSTSKYRHIAERFAKAPSTSSRPLSVLCIYSIPEKTKSYGDNVVLDISTISEYPHEEEVLILPHTSLKVKSITHLPSGLIEVDMRWYSFLLDELEGLRCVSLDPID